MVVFVVVVIGAHIVIAAAFIGLYQPRANILKWRMILSANRFPLRRIMR
jgi:hypothetical protein